jgi:hypothetical protein
LLETNANGAWCDFPQQLTCRAAEQAVVNYVEKQLSKHDYFTIRNEFFDDAKGQRTGFKTRYSAFAWLGTLDWNHDPTAPGTKIRKVLRRAGLQ